MWVWFIYSQLLSRHDKVKVVEHVIMAIHDTEL